MKRFKHLFLVFALAAAVLLSACNLIGGDGTTSPESSLAPDPESLVEIDLFAVNDLHGKFLDGDAQPGVDELTTYLKDAKADNGNTFIFSSGDMWQGSAESGLTQGKIMTDWMNYLDFEFMTLGNHEFDWGDSYIYENEAVAEFPFLAINIYDEDTDARADFCESSVLVDLGEVQIGFIGAIGDCYSSISGESSEGYYFLVGNRLTELVKAESDKLKGEGADIIVYSIHDGIEEYDIALSAGGYVDVVFEGHTHSSYVKKDVHGVYHLQGGGENSGISHAELIYNLENGELSVDAETVAAGTYSSSADDPVVEELSKKYEDVIGTINGSIGFNDRQKSATELKNLVAELYRDVAQRWSDYDVVLGGGFISCRSPGTLPFGDVTYGDLYMLFPFDNKLALCSCSGDDLLKNYINTTNRNYFVAYTEYGEDVRDSIDPNATYYVITDSYNYTYAPNRLTVVEIFDNTTYARDLVAEYVKNGGMGERPESDENAPDPNERHSIGTLVDYVLTLPEGAQTESKYYVTGKITQMVNSTYGNCYIEDENGDTLYVYGIRKDGVRYDSMTEKPRVGDTVTLYGYLMHYVGQNGSVPEMVNGEPQ